jgi:hypothetical protein
MGSWSGGDVLWLGLTESDAALALGGRPSERIRKQMGELTDHLVGLTDAALDRRTAALDSENQAAVAPREALARRRAEEQGFREVGQLDTEQ